MQLVQLGAVRLQSPDQFGIDAVQRRATRGSLQQTCARVARCHCGGLCAGASLHQFLALVRKLSDPARALP